MKNSLMRTFESVANSDNTNRSFSSFERALATALFEPALTAKKHNNTTFQNTLA